MSADVRAIGHAELASIAGELTTRGGCLRFSAGGRSMWPFVRSGDTLVVEPLGERPPAIGDVLLYRTPGGGVAAHRVVGFAGRTLRIRGDRLRAPLELVQPEALLGRVAAVERGGRRRRAGRPPHLWLAARELLRALWRLAPGRRR